MPSSDPLEHLTGLIERVTFHNEENGFCVLKVKVRGKRDLVMVVGHLCVVSVGERIEASGQWLNDRQHGLQFKAELLKATPPSTCEGITKYLGSGMIQGIGPVYAKRLVKVFGQDVFEIFETSPHRLQEVEGIGPGRSLQILKSWAEQKIIRQIMIFLHSHGISTARALRIYKTYGQNAIDTIREDPYRLARDIQGIGFISADQIAQKMGIEATSVLRARAAISCTLTTALDEGHCGLPQNILIERCQELLQISQEGVLQALSHELSNGQVILEEIEGTFCVFLKRLAYAETSIARSLLNLAQGPPPWGCKLKTEMIETVIQSTGIHLSDSQKQALYQTLRSKVTILTGGPGVGKTTLIRSVVQVLKRMGVSIALSAPTGRAAKRLFESTGMETKTIHRLLEIDPRSGRFSRKEDSPLNCHFLVVDEVSMMDVPLMHALLKAIPVHSALLLVGDVDQLPSVGPGRVFSDLIEANCLPCIRLTEVFRQAATSRIIQVSHQINRGEMPDLSPIAESDFYFLEAQTPEKALSLIQKLLLQRIPKVFGLSPLSDVQVLCPMNRGLIGTRTLNADLQKILNPQEETSVQRFGWTFKVGDKVMQSVNNYDKDVFNGDIGRIIQIDSQTFDVTIEFEGRAVLYDPGELDEVVLAYAVTIHKSQGSEYPCVIVPLFMSHYKILKRNLLYTGLTRGKKLVVIVGQKKALAMAIEQHTATQRWSTLKKRLLDLQVELLTQN